MAHSGSLAPEQLILSQSSNPGVLRIHYLSFIGNKELVYDHIKMILVHQQKNTAQTLDESPINAFKNKDLQSYILENKIKSSLVKTVRKSITVALE